MMNMLFVDLVRLMVSIINYYLMPLLLPTRAITELIKQNTVFFTNIINIEHEYLIYH